MAVLATTRRYNLAQRNLVRAVLLEYDLEGYTVGLLCQDVTAAADAADAGEQLVLEVGHGATLEQAFYRAEQRLTYEADYKLCEYVLLCGNPSKALLQQYLDFLISDSTKGKLSAYLYAINRSVSKFAAVSDEKGEHFADWIETLREHKAQCPRVYDSYSSAIVVPILSAQDTERSARPTGAWLMGNDNALLRLGENEAQMMYLLLQRCREVEFFIQGKQIVLELQAISFERCEPKGGLCMTIYSTTPSVAQISELQTQLKQLVKQVMTTCENDMEELLRLEYYNRMTGAGDAEEMEVDFKVLSAGMRF